MENIVKPNLSLYPSDERKTALATYQLIQALDQRAPWANDILALQGNVPRIAFDYFSGRIKDESVLIYNPFTEKLFKAPKAGKKIISDEPFLKNALGEDHPLFLIASTIFNALVEHDPHTALHAFHLARINMALVYARGHRTAQEMAYAFIIGLLHDTGKLTVESSLLCETGKISPDQLRAIRSHACAGYEILNDLKTHWNNQARIMTGKGRKVLAIGEEFNLIALTALCHHETPNQNGYPLGIDARTLPYIVQDTSAGDSAHAAGTRSSYKAPIPAEKVLNELKTLANAQFCLNSARLMHTLIKRGDYNPIIMYSDFPAHMIIMKIMDDADAKSPYNDFRHPHGFLTTDPFATSNAPRAREMSKFFSSLRQGPR